MYKAKDILYKELKSYIRIEKCNTFCNLETILFLVIPFLFSYSLLLYKSETLFLNFSFKIFYFLGGKLKRIILLFFIFPFFVYSYNTIKTDNCYIHFPDNVPKEVGVIIGEYAEGAFKTLESLYSYNPGKVHIHIHNSVDVINAITDILLFNKIDLYLTSSITEPDFKNSSLLKRLIIHEMTHVFDLNMTRGYSSFLKTVFGKPYIPFTTPNLFKPFWIIEGIAVFNEAYFTDGDRINDAYFDATLRNYSIYGFPSMDKATSYYTNPKYPIGSTPYYIGAFMLLGISKYYYDGGNPTARLSNVHAGRFYYFVNYGLETFISELDDNSKKSRNDEVSYTDFYARIITDEINYQQEKINKIKSFDYTSPIPLYWSKEFSIVENFCVYDNYVYIIVSNTRQKNLLLLYDINTGKTYNINKGFFSDFIDIDTTGKYVVFGMYERVNSSVISKLFLYDTRRKDIIDTGLERVVWASISYLGDKIVVMRNRNDGNKEIGLYYIDTKEYKKLDININSYYPLFIDDDNISYFRKENKKYNLYIFKINAQREELISSLDVSVSNPRFSNGKIVFASDKTGVYNIYSFDIYTKTLSTLTNVITLADKPFLSDNKLYFITLTVNGPTLSYSEIKKYSPPILSFKRIESYKYSSAKIEDKIENYNPFSYLSLYWWLPYITFYDKEYSIGAITSWQDPLKEHDILLYASIDNKSRAEYNLKYSFVNSDSGLGFILDSSRAIKIYEVPVNPTGLDDYYQSDYNNSLYLLYSYSTLTSNIIFLLGGIYNYWDNEKEPDNMYYKLYTGSFYGPSGGIILDFTSYYFQNIKSKGLKIKTFVNKYLEPKSTEVSINLNINADTGFIIPNSVFSVKLESKGLWGKKFPQMYYTIGGIDKTLDDSPIFRGYSTEEFGGYYYILGNIEYTIPLFSIFSGFGNKPFFIKEIFLNPFYDFGQVSNYGFNDIKMDKFDISYGSELGLSMFLGYAGPLNILFGYAVTYPEERKVFYARLSVSVEF